MTWKAFSRANASTCSGPTVTTKNTRYKRSIRTLTGCSSLELIELKRPETFGPKKHENTLPWEDSKRRDSLLRPQNRRTGIIIMKNDCRVYLPGPQVSFTGFPLLPFSSLKKQFFPWKPWKAFFVSE